MTSEERTSSEIIAILKVLGVDYVSKIPLNVLELLYKTADINNLPYIDPNKGIEEQDISEDARAFLAMLKYRYWCKSEKEKQELLAVIQANETNNTSSFSS